jgi:hypothetical protein
MPARPDQELFRFRRAAFYSGLKSSGSCSVYWHSNLVTSSDWLREVGLIAAKAVALRVNMNTDDCLLASHVAWVLYLSCFDHCASLAGMRMSSITV